MTKKTLTCIYRALVGSIFDYSFFAVAFVSETSLGLVQRVQNRAIRCIYRLEWESPTKELFSTSGVLNVKERLLQLGACYLTKAIKRQNPFICPLISEYIRSWSAITARSNSEQNFFLRNNFRGIFIWHLYKIWIKISKKNFFARAKKILLEQNF